MSSMHTDRSGSSSSLETFASPEKHGFARDKKWIFDDSPPPTHPIGSNGKVSVDLLLKPSEDDLKSWPHRFKFCLRVFLGTNGDLTMISQISKVRIEGLETLDYLDNLRECERFTEQGDAITFESEVDRVYLGSPNVVAILDHEKKRTYVLKKEGLPDVVVWNPWEKKSKSMLDFGDQEYKQMLCVDGAAVETPIALKPGGEWTGQLELSCVPSSFCSDYLDHLGENWR